MANYVIAIMNAVSNESKHGPRLFTIEPLDGKWYKFTSKLFRLQLWCEANDCQHPLFENGLGIYEFEASRDWLKRIAPYANFVAGFLRTLLPFTAPLANLVFGEGTIDQIGVTNHLNIMKEAIKRFIKGDL